MHKKHHGKRLAINEVKQISSMRARDVARGELAIDMAGIDAENDNTWNELFSGEVSL
jgi:hypothetical protein